MLTAVKILSIVTVCIAAIVYVNRDDTGTISANLALSHSFQGSDIWGVFSGSCALCCIACLYIVSEAKLRILYVLYN